MKKNKILKNFVHSVLILTLTLFLSSLNSCKDDPIVSEKGVLKCTLNGSIWKSERQLNDSVKATIATISNTGILTIRGISTLDDTSAVTIRLNKPYPGFTGIYEDSTGNNSSIGYARFYPKFWDITSRNDINFTSSYKKTWTVRITKYDQVNKLISGDFEINQISTISGSPLLDYHLKKGFFNDLEIQ